MHAERRNRAILPPTLTLLACLLLTGCGSGGSNNGQAGGGGQNPGGGQPGGSVTFESRQPTFEAAQAKRVELDNLPKDARNQQMNAFLQTRPGVAETGISEDG